MKKWMTKLLALACVFTFAAGALTGCNTLRGAGQDVEEAGEGIQEVAE